MENKIITKTKLKFDAFDAALASLLFIIYNFLFLQVFSIICPQGVAENSFELFVLQFLIEALFGVAAVSVALARKVKVFSATGLNKRINTKIVLLGLCISLVGLYGFGNLTNVFLQILEICGYKSQLGSININTFWQYLGYVLASCVAPAIGEELLFRGTILSGLKAYGLKISVLVSAVIFTLMHGNAEQTVHQFIIGVIVGYIFYKSGNLWLGIIIHFFNNFISVTQAYMLTLIGGDVVAETQTNITVLSFIINVLVALIMAYVGLMIIKWLIAKILDEDAKLNNSNVVSETEQTIIIDGAEVQDQVVTVETATGADGKTAAVSDNADMVENSTTLEKKPLSVSTIVLFALSGAILIFEWAASLLMGLGLV